MKLLYKGRLKVFDTVQEFISKAMTLPGEGEIMDMMPVADPDAVHAVRTFIRKELAVQLKQELLAEVSYFLFECIIVFFYMIVCVEGCTYNLN